MQPTWDHPQLGPFTRSGQRWTAIVDLPAFSAFSYKPSHWDNPDELLGKFKLSVGGDQAAPRPAAVELAQKIISMGSELPSRVVAWLWDDFNGQPPNLQSPWTGVLRSPGFASGVFGKLVPRAANDLFRELRLTRIAVDRDVDNYDGEVVRLSFKAAFDEEHGLDLLTDGDRVLGVGYVGLCELPQLA